MNDQYIVAVFPSRSTLLNALDYIQRLDLADLQKAAIVAKGRDGRLLLLSDGLGGSEGGLLGGVVGALVMVAGVLLLGAVTMPPVTLALIVTLAGAVGWTIGWLVGISTGGTLTPWLNLRAARDQFNGLAERLQAGHPALVLRVTDAKAVLDKLQADLKPYQAELVDVLNTVQQAFKGKA